MEFLFECIFWTESDVEIYIMIYYKFIHYMTIKWNYYKIIQLLLIVIKK